MYWNFHENILDYNIRLTEQQSSAVGFCQVWGTHFTVMFSYYGTCSIPMRNVQETSALHPKLLHPNSRNLAESSTFTKSLTILLLPISPHNYEVKPPFSRKHSQLM